MIFWTIYEMVNLILYYGWIVTITNGGNDHFKMIDSTIKFWLEITIIIGYFDYLWNSYFNRLYGWIVTIINGWVNQFSTDCFNH